MPGNFFDSNTLLYVTSGETAKADRAEQLIRAGGTISVQVLNEIANVTRRKWRYSWSRTNNLLAQFRGLLSVVPVTLNIHEVGIGLAERYGLSVYDGMIVAAALSSGCDTLWSEDMQDGLVIDRALTVVNPFRVAS
ncbi:MAG TPA: PIN domain-containing protein [Stellaceae bacterium]|jgi:predicted nucleic acid-binding protein|nr:PIN domain-containing protein [Stellaceae bacterium]